MKRILYSLICVVLLTVCFAVSVSAEEADRTAEIEDLIMQGIACGVDIDIRSYELTPAELQEIYQGLFLSGKLPWYVDSYCDYVMSQNGIVAYYRPRDLKKSGFDEFEYEKAMAELIAVTCPEGLEDWQIALNVHDYIVANCSYDELLLRNSAYHALVKGVSACYGYAQLYMDVMQRVGIPCQIVYCNELADGYGHAWNAIQLNGEWYHVDLTWDDPVPNMEGLVLHDHFLRTDEQFRHPDNGHDSEWITDLVCDGKTYSSGMFWDDLWSQVTLLDSETGVLQRCDFSKSRVCTLELSTNNEYWLYTFDKVPTDIGHGLYLYQTFGLSVWNDRLYFNSESAAFSMKLDLSDFRVEYAHVDGADETYIFSSHASDGILYLTLCDHDFHPKTVEIPLEIPSDSHIHSYDSVKTPATCTTQGYTEHTCSCGISFRTDHTALQEHTLQSAMLAAPTEEKEGTKRHTCLQCGYYEDEVLPRLEPAPEPTPEEPQEEIAEQIPNDPVPLPPEQDSDKSKGISPVLIISGCAAIAAALVILALVLLKRKNK